MEAAKYIERGSRVRIRASGEEDLVIHSQPGGNIFLKVHRKTFTAAELEVLAPPPERTCGFSPEKPGQ